MLIHGSTRNGDPIPMKPHEALSHVVVREIAKLNTKEKVLLPKQDTVKVSGTIAVAPGADKGEWTAEAEGTVMVGHVRTKCGTVCADKLYNFKMKFHSAKDELGIPDVKTVPETVVIAPAEAMDIGAIADPDTNKVAAAGAAFVKDVAAKAAPEKKDSAK